MPKTVSNLAEMIGGMDPVLDEAAYRFVPVEPAHAPQILGGAIATFREAEGVSAIIPFILADELGFEAPEFARITLQVASDLEASGLTAAVATALAREGIACNMVAALHHDHAFVPLARADDAMRVLRGLQDG